MSYETKVFALANGNGNPYFMIEVENDTLKMF